MRLSTLVLTTLMPLTAQATPIDVLFVGNSYTFGRYDPVESYNTANVTDLTAPERGGTFADTTGTNDFEPHPWGGVPGIFKRLTDQAGLDYNVSISARNAASLRGHFLNLNPSDWDLRGNIALQTWDQVVLQEQSDEVLPRQSNASGATLRSNPEYTRYFADTIEDFLHSSAETGTIRYRDAFPGDTSIARQAACESAGVSAGTCRIDRGSYSNLNASADTDVFLYQTWARPDLVDGAFETIRNDDGSIVRTDEPSTETFYGSLDEMTAELMAGYQEVVDQADDDGSPGFAGIAPVGEAFQRAIDLRIATSDFWGPGAESDGLIDLWFDDGTHASTYGSYLSGLVMYGTLTGRNPSLFGAGELAASELGISSQGAVLLQRVASDQLGFAPAPSPVPLPAAGSLLMVALTALGFAGNRRRKKRRMM